MCYIQVHPIAYHQLRTSVFAHSCMMCMRIHKYTYHLVSTCFGITTEILVEEIADPYREAGISNRRRKTLVCDRVAAEPWYVTQSR